MTEKQAAPVVVTTAHRGVFFGYLAGDRAGKTIELTNAQMCVYWSSDVRGILGLASGGPSRTSKVTRPVPRITLQDVTSVIDVTDEAVKQWLGRPWS
jgi:hypothetical protein